MIAVVTIGFVKDAKQHLDIQGFNVYHKNRLIKPFWNAAGSDGRGVIGVLEANFVEPAHDKQGFERTLVLSRLKARLNAIQKNFWATNCHLIGYAKRRHSIKSESASVKDKALSHSKPNNKHDATGRSSSPIELDDVSNHASEEDKEDNDVETSTRKRKGQHKSKCSSTSEDSHRHPCASNLKTEKISGHLSKFQAKKARIIGDDDHTDSTLNMELQLNVENSAVRERLHLKYGIRLLWLQQQEVTYKPVVIKKEIENEFTGEDDTWGRAESNVS